MRECWNWQTGTFEGRVLYDVRVQVPSRAPKNPHAGLDLYVDFFVFLCYIYFKLLCNRHVRGGEG
jgi:hypothetical protein